MAKFISHKGLNGESNPVRKSETRKLKKKEERTNTFHSNEHGT